MSWPKVVIFFVVLAFPRNVWTMEREIEVLALYKDRLAAAGAT